MFFCILSKTAVTSYRILILGPASFSSYPMNLKQSKVFLKNQQLLLSIVTGNITNSNEKYITFFLLH